MAPSGNSSCRAPAGAGTVAARPTAASFPRSSMRTAPSAMGGAVTGCTEPARIRSIRSQVSGAGCQGSRCLNATPDTWHPTPRTSSLRRDADAERRVHRTGLAGLGARVEPVPVTHFLGTERRGEVAVRPIHLARDERVGSHPIGRRGPAGGDIAHERGPRGRDDLAPAPVVLEDALLDVVADPDAPHQPGG